MWEGKWFTLGLPSLFPHLQTPWAQPGRGKTCTGSVNHIQIFKHQTLLFCSPRWVSQCYHFSFEPGMKTKSLAHTTHTHQNPETGRCNHCPRSPGAAGDPGHVLPPHGAEAGIWELWALRYYLGKGRGCFSSSLALHAANTTGGAQGRASECNGLGPGRVLMGLGLTKQPRARPCPASHKPPQHFKISTMVGPL